MGEWEEYKQLFGKVYHGDEDSSRKAIFESNKLMWGDHESGAVLGATQFSDMTLEEFQAMPIRGFAAGSDLGLPKLGEHTSEEFVGSVDWTTRGAVTPVKNQGQCGSCWAFSTVAGLEGAWQLASGSLTSMSEQFFVDCSKQNSGCNGGLMDQGFSFAQSHAVATESSYPYTARDGTCKTSYSTAIPVGGVTGYTDVSKSASSLKSALDGQPVSVAIQADQSVFQQYTGGVITSGCGTSLDHGVTAVGYDGNTIKVKNSWGSSWGVGGYVSIDASQCGITSSASFPKVSAGGPTPSPVPPTPSPVPPTPVPVPSPSPSDCEDIEDHYYCDYVVQQGWCGDIGSDCLLSCDCCDDHSKCGQAPADTVARVKQLLNTVV